MNSCIYPAKQSHLSTLTCINLFFRLQKKKCHSKQSRLVWWELSSYLCLTSRPHSPTSSADAWPPAAVNAPLLPSQLFLAEGRWWRTWCISPLSTYWCSMIFSHVCPILPKNLEKCRSTRHVYCWWVNHMPWNVWWCSEIFRSAWMQGSNSFDQHPIRAKFHLSRALEVLQVLALIWSNIWGHVMSSCLQLLIETLTDRADLYRSILSTKAYGWRISDVGWHYIL